MYEYKKYFTLSYDDGLEQDKRIVELMKKYGIRGTFNLNSGILGQQSNIEYVGTIGFKNVEPSIVKNGLIKTAPANRIPEDEIKQVYEGFELATHGAHHLHLGKLSRDELKEEIIGDRDALEKYTDIPVVGHAFPFGGTSDAAKQVLKEAGIIYARGLQHTKGKGEERFAFPSNPFGFAPTCWHIDKNIMELFDQFMSITPTKGDMLFYMWGHGYELDFDVMKKRNLLDTMERMFDRVSNDDSVIACTNAEAFTMHSSGRN